MRDITRYIVNIDITNLGKSHPDQAELQYMYYLDWLQNMIDNWKVWNV